MMSTRKISTSYKIEFEIDPTTLTHEQVNLLQCPKIKTLVRSSGWDHNPHQINREGGPRTSQSLFMLVHRQLKFPTTLEDRSPICLVISLCLKTANSRGKHFPEIWRNLCESIGLIGAAFHEQLERDRFNLITLFGCRKTIEKCQILSLTLKTCSTRLALL